MQNMAASFVLRFNLETEIPDELLEDDEFDERAWLQEWEGGVKPAIVRAVFQTLRAAPGWEAHVRNRGVPAEDEIEIVVRRSY